MQKRSRVTDTDDKYMDTKGERGWGDEPGDWYGHMHITDTVHKVDRASLTAPWVKKMWHIYTMEYYSVIRRNKIQSVVIL